MLTTLYIIVTLIIFSLNFLANVAVLATNKKDKFPAAAFVATMFSIIFVIWGISLLLTN
jgi:hypothetical protein